MPRISDRPALTMYPEVDHVDPLPTGQLLMTRGVAALVKDGTVNPLALLARHIAHDWGEVDGEDWQTNNRAAAVGLRVLSEYHPAPGVRVWIITEADRSATTLLLPDEY